MDRPGQLRRFIAPRPCASGDVITLDAQQSRHMVAVLRIGAGERVRIFTGQGQEFLARVEEADPAAARVRIGEPYRPGQGVPAHLTLAFAPPSGQRADLVVEKATELGVNVLVPLLCERLQGFRAAAAAGRAERWERKAQEAARQCGRALVPHIAEPVSLGEFVAGCGDAVRLVADPEAPTDLWQTLAGHIGVPPSLSMAVGPAGGLTRAELDLAVESGFRAVRLGPHVLRVETAAICMLGGVVLWLEAGRQEGGSG
jgi:16S rRNA (uracil1498-N3)-methyltransferase